MDGLSASEITTIVGVVIAAGGTIAGAAKVTWSWMTGLVERFQQEATVARQQFLAENTAARSDFLRCLREIEDRREKADQTVLIAVQDLSEAMISIKEILRERGIPAPQPLGVNP